MLKIVVFSGAIAFSGAAPAQQLQADAKGKAPSGPEQSAAAGGSSALRCDFLSREEMLMCQATKPGDVSGARSSMCDIVSANAIESCLKQQESVSSDPANEFRDRSGAKGSG